MEVRDDNKIYEKLLLYQEQLHKQNQQRIRVGLKCLFLVPFVFLVLLFVTDSEKVIFLILWIVSLFFIAAYLIYVEYSDFKVQVLVAELNNKEFDPKKGALIGKNTEILESNIISTLDQIDERKEKARELLEKKADDIQRAILKEEGKDTDEEHTENHSE